MKKYYLDTCIWRDFYENRKSIKGNPLGAYAHDLIMKIILRKDKIIISKAIFWELSKDYTEQDIQNMFQLLFLNKILIHAKIMENESSEAKQLSQERNLPKLDCLYAVQSRNHNAQLVTQNRHFLQN